MTTETKTNGTHLHSFSRASRQLHKFASRCDWFVVFSASFVIGFGFLTLNRPRSNMAPKFSGQTFIFGVVFFVSKSRLGIERQKKLKKFTISYVAYDEGPELETSAFKSLYGRPFHIINPVSKNKLSCNTPIML